MGDCVRVYRVLQDLYLEVPMQRSPLAASEFGRACYTDGPLFPIMRGNGFIFQHALFLGTLL